MAIDAALVLDEGMVGMMEESTTRKAAVPRTRKAESTTAFRSESGPILQVPMGCQEVCPQVRMYCSRASSD